MTNELKVYLFGDETFPLQPGLRTLLHHRSNIVLDDFLVRAYDAIRVLLYELPPAVRENLPNFTCLEDLLLWSPGVARCVPLEMAMRCLYQVGLFMVESDIEDFSSASCRVLGHCTGALVAAAVRCSRSPLDLVQRGLETIVVAFRTGLLVADMAQRMMSIRASDQSQSWSIIVSGLAAVEAVDQFCKRSNPPMASRPYVSAYAPNGVTVSGSPTALADLVVADEFKDFKYKAIPIYGPYHAAHLYSQHDVHEVVSGAIATRAVGAQPCPPVSDSEPDRGREDFASSMERAVADILLHPIRWDGIVDQLQTWLREVQPASLKVVPIASSADRLIYTALKQTEFASLVPSSLNPPSGPAKSPVPPMPTGKKPKLAIVGMSGRFPGAKDNDAFWDLLHQGLDVHKPVPDLHWDARTHVDPAGIRKNTSATPFGCWLDNPAAFDARFFNISPREAPQIDPAQRLALMTAYEAIEQAGLVPDATPSTRRDRVGVFYGVTSNDWMETNSAQDIDTYFIPGGNRAFIPGRINYCFRFSGPSYAVDTACSSSLAGIHLACNALWQRDIDTAIAGGTNVLTNPDFTAGLDRGHFLSRTGNCKTFDDQADGYCRGEGIGTVILKRLDDALLDNDPILGVIVGAYTNHSAESESITRPHSGAQRAIFSKILNESAVHPHSVSYVEMHGTGTQAGDAGEMSSVLDTFAPPPSQGPARAPRDALYLGSAKSNIGHGEAASGVSSLIKVLLMMQKNTIVPHCGIKTRINRKFPTDLRERNVHIALQPTSWNRSSRSSPPRRAFVNNFSAAGGNSALLLEDAPCHEPVELEGADPRSHHVVAVSAKVGSSLQGNIQALLAFLKNSKPGIPLGQLSYTTTARRMHHPHRAMLVGSTVEELCAEAQAALRNGTGMTRPKSAPKIVFTFTGQGAQYPGMGKDFFAHFSLFRTEICRLDQMAQNMGFPSFLPVIQSVEQDIAAFDPIVVQLASVCLQIAMSRLWASWNITPSAVVGHSLGEYAALNVAGVISDADTVYLVGKRAELLQKTCTRDTHAMLVVRGAMDDIASILGDQGYEIACINSPVETVIAGLNDHVAAWRDSLARSGVKCTLLKVPYAFHSAQVDPILSEFASLADRVTFAKPRIPVLRPLDGGVDDSDDFGGAYLAAHARQPVNMLNVLEVAYSKKLITDQTALIEIGPHPAVSGMVKAVLGSQAITLPSAQRARSIWQTITAALKQLYISGANVHWANYHRDFRACHKVIPLPAYNWDLKDYWIQYVNDWSLRKGDPPLMAQATTLKSTTIHRVIEESGDHIQRSHIVVESDIAREDLSPLVQGHEVDGIPLCTPSVYADMALTMGKYLLERCRSGQEDNLVDVSNMTISKALILREGVSQQLLQAHADVNWTTQSTEMKFMSFNTKGTLQEHARCTVLFKNNTLRSNLQQSAPETKRKMQALRAGITSETTARFNRPMVYRMIRPLARFHADYRAIDEIVLNSSTLEASSRLSFGSVKRGGDFHTHPAIIDALTQSCGFAMNCNDRTDLDVEVFMNHGWGSLQIFEPIEFDKVYTTYTRMEEGKDKLWHGDVVIFDGDTVVAYFGQIAIQGVPRRVLKVILSLEKGGDRSKKSQPELSLQPLQFKTNKTPPSATPRSSRIAKALSIIADESGLAVADLTDNTVFADAGIDSLLSLTISARFKEELDLDVDFNAFSFDYPTVGDLKGLLCGEDETTSGSSSSSGNGQTTPVGHDTETTTPSEFSTKIDFDRVLEIIAEESGISREEFTDDTNFADSGVDSLLSLVVVSRFRDELELDIQHESLFLECPTVADLKMLLVGAGSVEAIPIPIETVAAEELETLNEMAAGQEPNSCSNDDETLELTIRKKAVDELVDRYTASFSVPDSLPSSATGAPNPNEKVVLVTGATGSLGGHLVYHLAQLPCVETVVCLNREHRSGSDPYTRQQKAMREKGIRFPDALKPKLLVLQTDTSKPMLGLAEHEYKRLVGSVTHLIHNAWPMSAKRPLSGFESQFAVLQNLTDFACEVIAHRPREFKFSFQMVSSIGVVGRYGHAHGPSPKCQESPTGVGNKTPTPERTLVPESPVDIPSVLPNGYSEAKWGCERMIQATMQTHPERFRSMIVRLGQIAGSKTSGYWNPMEHFGFMMKSSQTLGVLPDVPGTVFWTPVNDVAGTLCDLVLAEHVPYPVYHVENPVGRPWSEVNGILADGLGIPALVPFGEWLARVRAAPQRGNPAATLVDFLEETYLRMSCGGLVLDVKHTLEHSETLAAVGAVSEEVIRKYIHIWKEIGFLD
ncbi:Male sterility, NAD-binding [Aspergillus mulundensis]|uniref:Male sterility, NAD-binding n=1 Tax=Aspergillus mulundensis TaxID=1810919 RepID=A0A3D8QSH5_9EURO|nr:Male sterility, NAD-binding [Aspergillus mulundensis]RDW64444.1 Male sterility, NAD-binding [Aspergillus mulundensis]